MRSYLYSVNCPECGAHRRVSHVTVGLFEYFCAQANLLGAQSDTTRYFCPKCFLAVVLPRRIESRFLLEAGRPTDDYGNPSPFRERLLQQLKQFAQPQRVYALVTIPELEIPCPDDREQLEVWRNYPEKPRLPCDQCGSRRTKLWDHGVIGFQVVTGW